MRRSSKDMDEGAALALFMPVKAEVREFWNDGVYDICSCLDESDLGYMLQCDVREFPTSKISILIKMRRSWEHAN